MRRSSQGVMSLSYDTGSGRGLLACYAKAKPRPSKWDDAQRWLSSRAPDDDQRRSSCADDRMLLPSASQKWRHSWSATDVAAVAGVGERDDRQAEVETETKRVDSVLAYGQQRCLLLRDVGTEMTPGGSKEPSRVNTPRAAAPPPASGGRAIHAPRRRPCSTDAGSPGPLAAARGAACGGADTEARKEAAMRRRQCRPPRRGTPRSAPSTWPGTGARR